MPTTYRFTLMHFFLDFKIFNASVNFSFFFTIIINIFGIIIITFSTLLIRFLNVFWLGPSAVENLWVAGDTNSLEVSWQPGPGKTERYWIMLIDSSGMGSIWNATVVNTATSYTIKGLIPGRLYNITVITEVGELQNSGSRQVQTGILHWIVK